MQQMFIRIIAFLLFCFACCPVVAGSVRLELRAGSFQPEPELTRVIPLDSDQEFHYDDEVVISDNDVAGASLRSAGDFYEIHVSLTEAGAKKFAETTKANIRKPIGIFIDGELISAPIVMEAVTGGEFVISGDFAKEEADRIVRGIDRTVSERRLMEASELETVEYLASEQQQASGSWQGWYSTLNRPPLTPPDWIFGPVWTVLYVMIAVSLILYIRKTRHDIIHWATVVIVIHLATNVSWTGVFFGLQKPGWAFVDILLLDLTLVVLVVHFWRISRVSSMLLFPYLAWVLFATYLNAGFYWLN